MALAAIAGTAIALPQSASAADNSQNTTTPIKHVVVLFDENVSFDHYFGTYPKATNADGTPFTAAAGTPAVNTLASSGTLTTNPNAYAPKRLTPQQAMTCDQNHGYLPEQKAVNGGAMDKFVESTSVDTCTGLYGSPGLTMDYFDGNTVTGLWNYAQNYAMSDNAWDTTFGPSTPGALNLVSGNTHGGTAVDSVTGTAVPTSTSVVAKDSAGQGTVIGDPDPAFDDCSDKDHTSTSNLVKMAGTNIGDLLNAKGVTWGWFQGGFAPTTPYAGGATYAKCDATTTNVGGSSVTDYSPHHNPFAYYQSTANPHHLAPTSDSMIGYTDQANHEYDLTKFDTALAQGHMPAVSFLKAPEARDGHAAYSDPIDEQKFLTTEINQIEQSPEWSSTAIVVNYDDSDGWYDHVAPTILNGSTDSSNDTTVCTTAAAKVGVAGGYLDRCGPSQRLPYLVISPFAKQNAVDHTAIEQTSTTKFIEDNWSTGRIGDQSFDARAGSIAGMLDFTHPQQREVLLDTTTGAVSRIVSTAATPTPTPTPTASAPASSTPTPSTAPGAGGGTGAGNGAGSGTGTGTGTNTGAGAAAGGAGHSVTVGDPRASGPGRLAFTGSTLSGEQLTGVAAAALVFLLAGLALIIVRRRQLRQQR
ncbi:phospholipase C [Curtobacterium sp. ISL-83]|uniref:phospholipase C n=1 Tax=Curtobacterium sp. ISL-83 TaxID=2819145 RepID=UPI001BE91178|nr:alkaline phosphatase family protein [Curtobacterium sp. ISL-83]MBT2502689.1 alkaline phosphatase family protein [Curtobacterium sp. ISL-83]